MSKMLTFDNELKILNYFRDEFCHPLGIPENERNFNILQSIIEESQWNNWINNSGKNNSPPDFINNTASLMMEIMRIDDNVSNEGKSNRLKKRENLMLKELEKSSLLDLLSTDATVLTIANTGLSTDEDHNYDDYFKNFKRIVQKHAGKVENYRTNYTGYKLIFFLFDESSGSYIESNTDESYIQNPVGANISGRPHFYWADKIFLNEIKKCGADYFIWFKPFSLLNTSECFNVLELPKVVIYDLSEINVEPIKYDPLRMVSNEI